jgi:hypothetical protein
MAAAGAVVDKSWTIIDLPNAVSFPIPYKFTVDLELIDYDHVDDIILLCKFPAGTYIPNREGAVRINFPTAIDDSTTLDFDLTIGIADGTVTYTLFTGEVVAGRTDNSCANSVVDKVASGLFLDVGDLYLTMLIDAVGDVATGTAEVVVDVLSELPNSHTDPS